MHNGYMDNILKKQLREYVNHYELFGDRVSLIIASMVITVLLNKDIDYADVNID